MSRFGKFMASWGVPLGSFLGFVSAVILIASVVQPNVRIVHDRGFVLTGSDKTFLFGFPIPGLLQEKYFSFQYVGQRFTARHTDGTPILEYLSTSPTSASEYLPNNKDMAYPVIRWDTDTGPRITILSSCYRLIGGNPQYEQKDWKCGGQYSLRDLKPQDRRGTTTWMLGGGWDTYESYLVARLEDGSIIYGDTVQILPPATYPIEPRVNLTISPDQEVDLLAAGQTITYTVSATNVGDHPSQAALNTMQVYWSPGLEYTSKAGPAEVLSPYAGYGGVLSPNSYTKSGKLEVRLDGIQPGETRVVTQMTFNVTDRSAMARFGLARDRLFSANLEGFGELYTPIAK